MKREHTPSPIAKATGEYVVKECESLAQQVQDATPFEQEYQRQLKVRDAAHDLLGALNGVVEQCTIVIDGKLGLSHITVMQLDSQIETPWQIQSK